MRKWIISIAALALLAIPADAQPKEINWQSYPGGLNSGRMVVLYVTTSGLDQMETYLWKFGDEAFYFSNADGSSHTFIKHDVGSDGEDDEVAKRYDLTAWPTVVFCDEYGNEVGNQRIGQNNQRQNQIKQHRMAIKAKMSKMPGDIKKLKKKIEKLYDTGERDFGNGRTKVAIQNLQKCAGYAGYEWCQKAEEKLDEINQIGEALLDGVDGADESQRKKVLKEVSLTYRGLPVAERAQELLDAE
jgi:hypothetical protein